MPRWNSSVSDISFKAIRIFSRKGALSDSRTSPPPERAAGVIVESVDELVEKLKNEAKVIT